MTQAIPQPSRALTKLRQVEHGLYELLRGGEIDVVMTGDDLDYLQEAQRRLLQMRTALAVRERQADLDTGPLEVQVNLDGSVEMVEPEAPES